MGEGTVRTRFGKEVGQERRSVGQFIDRLGELRWNSLEPSVDVGEDFLVQIFDEGISTGLSFYVQLKSIRDAERRKKKRGAEVLSYRLEVKDLEHWEVQTPLVVLFVWDVGKRFGYWETIPRIIERLEKKRKGWRNKGTVAVEVPVTQGTDDGGMYRLREMIAAYWLPLVVGEKKIKISFPATEAGAAMGRLLERGLERGERVVFEGSAIPEVKMPEWHRRLYGDVGMIQRIEAVPKQTSHDVPPLRVEISSATGTASISGVEFRGKRLGHKLIELSNDHQIMPWRFSFVTNEKGSELKLEQAYFGRSVCEAREAALFLFVASGARANLKFRDPRTNEVILQRQLHHFVEWNEIAKRRLELLDKLAVIESRIERYGAIHLEGGIFHEDARAIEIIYEICKFGKVKGTQTFSCEVRSDAEDVPQTEPSEVIAELSEFKVRLLGLEIPIGRVKHTIEDSNRFVQVMNAAIRQARETGQPVPVRIENLAVTTEYLDWPHPRDRLHDIASTQSGYFTLPQALEAGFLTAEELEIQRIAERCAADVFRLAHLPPSEHEDLVVIWLQTNKAAVFSHDTALALHQLSDILPTKRHITVPPGFVASAHAPIERGTMIHEALVDPSEITWMGPIPFTKALRTLEDCIKKGTSPDLLDQAITEAIERGLISKTEAQSLQLARAQSA